MTAEQLVRFRPITATDIAAIADSRSTDPAAGPADSRMAAYFEGRHHPQQALLPRVGYLASIGDGVVGYTAGHRTTRHGCDGEVQYLFVALAHRRRRIAAGLLRLLAGWFRAQGIHRVCVNVNLDSPAAVPFYTSLGASALNRHWYLWEDIAASLGGGSAQ